MNILGALPGLTLLVMLIPSLLPLLVVVGLLLQMGSSVAKLWQNHSNRIYNCFVAMVAISMVGYNMQKCLHILVTPS
tara:strand:+ start:518 stop:748 length:231 start_codon:yes stop_codon:yes gene_type:complete